ncbi:hypothetical protein OS190_11980 [Sulfitobacter sp. F26204]|uniref:hypothetical protein n=1 Tax=Sulfitobacter sp. F26204 TaxID=2996014 RepID=UPI00225E4585|nr:hypothetical protein [Sulfitobacter sp. F26204]MCX7560288.1 hypothetical protein [Sulfitobacter sp. F26204]
MTENFENCILTARAELQVARQRLNQEISGYPAPIAGCDVQFNHLLAERERVCGALQILTQSIFIPTPRTPTATAGVESR